MKGFVRNPLRNQPKRITVLLLLLALVVSSFLPLEVKAFDDDTHLYMKYALLREAGFTHDDALAIAQADVQVDYDSDTTASASEQARKDWHAFGTEAERTARRDALEKRAMDEAANAAQTGKNEDKQRALTYFGQYLHFLEDFYSHAGYGSLLGHIYTGHYPDYLSSYTNEQLQTWIEEWLGKMVEFLRKLSGQPPLTPEQLAALVNTLLQNIWPTCQEIINYNPPAWYNPFFRPDSDKAKRLLEEKYGLPTCTLSISKTLDYDNDGNVVRFVLPRGRFGLPAEQWLVYSSVTQEKIDVVMSSPWFSYHPEAGTAIILLNMSISDMAYTDPSIHNLGYAIANLTGLSNEDETVMNATIDLSFWMFDLVSMRHDYATYIALLKDIRYRADFNETLFEAYGEMEKAGTEIEKMDTNPHDADFGNLTSSLWNAWGYLREAEQIALAAHPGDVNLDGTVDIFDIVIVAVVFGSTRGDPNWDPNADINCDGVVDIFDIVPVALHFGETG